MGMRVFVKFQQWILNTLSVKECIKWDETSLKTWIERFIQYIKGKGKYKEKLLTQLNRMDGNRFPKHAIPYKTNGYRHRGTHLKAVKVWRGFSLIHRRHKRKEIY